jgi:hypothetical protein
MIFTKHIYNIRININVYFCYDISSKSLVASFVLESPLPYLEMQADYKNVKVRKKIESAHLNSPFQEHL